MRAVSRRASSVVGIVSALAACLAAACLPNGPPTGTQDAPASTAKKKPTATPLPMRSAMPSGPDPLLTETFEDAFDRGMVGVDWRTVGTGAWRIENGRLCGQRAKNRGIWLARRIPTNARIEFDAQSTSSDGDLKIEAWGDGLSGATGLSYTNATSYLAIYGGWKNSLHVLARIDEHGSNRKEIKVDPADDDPRARPVSPGQVYRFVIERNDGRTVRFSVNETVIHTMVDGDPLTGTGHDHFGFNDWEVPVCFDNVKVTPLP